MTTIHITATLHWTGTIEIDDDPEKVRRELDNGLPAEIETEIRTRLVADGVLDYEMDTTK